MKDFYINTLSLNAQCHSEIDTLQRVKLLIECLQKLGDAIRGEHIKLFFESNLEQKQLQKGKLFISSINSLPNNECNEDEENGLKQLWFQYTRNFSSEISSDTSETTINASCGRASGSISNDRQIQQAHWLSFGGNPLNEATEYNVTQEQNECFSVKNAHNHNTLNLLLPSYESSPKHHKERYYDHSRNEWVGAMPLDEISTRALLLVSIKDGDDLWAYHEKRKELYRFKKSDSVNTEKKVYHGFVVEPNDIPNDDYKRLCHLIQFQK